MVAITINEAFSCCALLILEDVKHFKGFHTLTPSACLASFFNKAFNCKFSYLRDFQEHNPNNWGEIQNIY